MNTPHRLATRLHENDWILSRTSPEMDWWTRESAGTRYVLTVDQRLDRAELSEYSLSSDTLCAHPENWTLRGAAGSLVVRGLLARKDPPHEPGWRQR